ncbi:DNA repair protein RadC [Myxococcota bacterium]|nr:DNA repair protein RadC [Myxococcota bacterium]
MDESIFEVGPRIVGLDRGELDSVGRARAEWPRERLFLDGARALCDVDLVALVLRTGDRNRDAWTLARRLIARFGGLAALAELAPAAIEAMPGVGPAKSASLAAALELGRRLVSVPLVRGQAIRSPEDVQRHFAPLFRGRARESFHVVLLDARHRLLSIDEVSVGTLTASLVHPREVFREAIRQAAAALVLVHHHPSGDPSPSAEDRSVTDRLAAAGRLLGIGVVDHVIVAESGFFSFQQAGCLDPAGAV